MKPLYLLSLLPLTLASPTSQDYPPEPYQLPLVIWHGLGDTFTNPSLLSLATLANTTHPNTTTHIISLSSSDSSDRTATFLGHLPSQLTTVCETLSTLPLLSSGFNAIGFSQGGQFLRGLIETCPTLPPVGTLITFGSQHAGIRRFLARCEPGDWTCALATRMLEGSRFSGWTQRNVVPAQYYRDPSAGPEDWERYLEMSGWIADVNNDRKEKNQFYRERIVKRLTRMVMVMWRDDTTVVPKESAWFAELERDDDEEEGVKRKVKWLKETDAYKEDWVGMKTLDKEERLEFLELDGGHMELEDEVLKEIFRVYLGPNGKDGEWKGKRWDSEGRRIEKGQGDGGEL